MAASRRKGWNQLSPGYRARLEKSGISQRAYERGQSIARARGHAETPEHGKKQAQRNPVRYRKYLAKREPRLASPEDEAYAINAMRDKSYANEKRQLGDLLQYNDKTVRTRVYGGWDDEGRYHDGQTMYEARWTSTASADALRGRAAVQDDYNVWWYH